MVAGLVRNTAVLSLGLAASQGLLLAVMPLWSRLYGPEQFAAFGVWTAVSSAVATLLLLRYDTCVVIAQDDDEARALRRLGLGLAAGGGLLLALLAWALPLSWRAAMGLAPLGHWLPFAVAAGALAAVFASGLAWLNRMQAYVRISSARVLLALVVAAAGSVMGVAGWEHGLLLAQLLGATSALLLLPWALTPHSGALVAARCHEAAPRWLWPAALLDTCTQQLPLLLTASWFGVALAGQFSLAWRVAALPVLLLAAAAGSVFYERFARLVADDQRNEARELLWRTWRGLFLVGAVPAGLLLAFGGPIFGALFGERWRDGGLLAAVMVPMVLAMLVSSPTSGALIVLGLQRHAVRFGLAMLLYRPAAFAIGAMQASLVLALALWGACEITAIVLYNRLLLRRLAD